MKPIIAAVVCALSLSAFAADPTPAEILAKYDAIMGPTTFATESVMTATREDGTSRSYVMKMMKRDDKFRIWFAEPAAVKGQEILRNGDNAWVYIPNLKRATRIANRDSFQGGDFNNADVLRVNYTADYDAKLAACDSPEMFCVDLKAKSAETSYDAIKLWIRKADFQPIKAQYFGTSGQMLRSAEFLDHTEFQKGFKRPARIVMHNELVKARQSEFKTKTFDPTAEAPAQRFTQSDLGK